MTDVSGSGANPYKMHSGLKQVDVLAPLFFNFVVEQR
jgi:hypothetical protein